MQPRLISLGVHTPACSKPPAVLTWSGSAHLHSVPPCHPKTVLGSGQPLQISRSTISATRSMPGAETSADVSVVRFVLRPGEVPVDDELFVVLSSDFKSSLVDGFLL